MPLLTDRTTITTDWDCARKRYWYKEFDGTGIVSVEEAQELVDGIAFHADMAAVAKGEDFPDAPDPGPDVPYQVRERWARRVGTRFAFKEWVWPGMLEQYGPPLATEAELILEHGHLWVATTPDLIIPAGNEIIVDDYKSFSSWNVSAWAAHWPFAVQMHVQLEAAEKEYGRKVKYGRVRGIVKGQVKDGLLRHPYVWAYSDGGDKWETDWKAGWVLRPTWEYPGGPEAWARSLGPEVGVSLFPLSQPIFKNDRLLGQFLAQTERRETEVASWRALPGPEKALILPRVFPQNFERCRPTGGHACPFLAACHNSTVGLDPLASGLYARRVPHHDLELIMAQETADE